MVSKVCSDIRPSFLCVFCWKSFKHVSSREVHLRKVHGLGGYREESTNLLLHLQHLSEESDCKNEWMFVESRPIDEHEPRICPCGQTSIGEYFFLENKLNGNRTYVGSDCVENIDRRVGKVIFYFRHILTHPIHGTFVENTSDGFQKFMARPYTVLVKRADAVKHLNPPITLTEDGKWEVLVKYSKPGVLEQGKDYELKLKAKYVRGQLAFIAM